jgi:hypothetical protein
MKLQKACFDAIDRLRARFNRGSPPLPQSQALKSAGCAEIHEEQASGGSCARPVLARVLERVAKGDTQVVVRIDRLARSLSHLLQVIERLEATGVEIELEGDLAALLRVATGSEGVNGTPASAQSVEARLECLDIIVDLNLVAGVGFEPTTFRL